MAGVPGPAYRMAEDVEDIASAAAALGLPVVVKPLWTGSSGARLCRDAEEIAERTRTCWAGRTFGGMRGGS